MKNMHRTSQKRLIPLVMAGGLLVAGSAFAESSIWQGGNESNARIFTAQDSEGNFHLALHISLGKGWKTYWRNAGDAGAPPRLIWRGSENIAQLSPQWPAPARFHAFGFDSFGFTKELVLPFKVVIKDPDKPVKVALAIDYLVCANICLPQSAKFSLTSNANDHGGKRDRRLLRNALSMVPKSNGTAPISISRVSLENDKDGEVLIITAKTKTIFGKPDVMVEAGSGYTFSRPQTEYSRDLRTATLRVKVRYKNDNPPSLKGKPLRITVVDDTETVDYRVKIAVDS